MGAFIVFSFYQMWYTMGMKDFIKKNFVLVLAFALPVVLILIVAASVYIPSVLLTTSYNFVYTTCGAGVDRYPYNCDNYLRQRYSVVEGKVVLNDISPTQDSDKDGIPDIDENYTTRIFLHDTEKNASREITTQEAQSLMLNGLLTSPDGVNVEGNWQGGGDFFLIFDGRSSYGYYLTKGKIKSKLQLINDDDRYYYRNNFYFLGWTLPGRS